MLREKWTSPGSRLPWLRRLLLVITCLAPVLTVGSCADASDPLVARHMGRFFETFLERNLTPD